MLAHSATVAADVPDSDKTHELTVVPLVGGNTDVGFGGGFLASYARLAPRADPYRWRVEAGGSLTAKYAGRLELPYTDEYLELDAPHVLPRLQLELRVSYTREGTLKFYGLGNLSHVLPNVDPDSRYFEYVRAHPTARWLATYHPGGPFKLLWGLAYTHNWLKVPENSALGAALEDGSPVEQGLLTGASDHGVPQLSVGFSFDTRDDEVSPTRGQYHTLRADLSPGSTDRVLRDWARVTAQARAYLPLVSGRLVLAGRTVVDALLGDVPFYELPRYADTFFGGTNGIRGVPGQLYYGKLKTFGTLELRARLFSFHAFGKDNGLGLAGFIDAGRVWADYAAHPELDGRGWGLKLGTGGGIRWQSGKSFVVRADVAYSPDARPIGAYLTAGETF